MSGQHWDAQQRRLGALPVQRSYQLRHQRSHAILDALYHTAATAAATTDGEHSKATREAQPLRAAAALCAAAALAYRDRCGPRLVPAGSAYANRLLLSITPRCEKEASRLSACPRYKARLFPAPSMHDPSLRIQFQCENPHKTEPWLSTDTNCDANRKQIIYTNARGNELPARS